MKTASLLTLAGAAILLAACSSSGKPAPSSSGPFTAGYGQDAGAVAAHIAGCGNRVTKPVNSDVTGMISESTCTLLGHKVTIYTWNTARYQHKAEQLLTQSLAYYAAGTGWDQIYGDYTPTSAEKTIAGRVAASLHGTVRRGQG